MAYVMAWIPSVSAVPPLLNKWCAVARGWRNWLAVLEAGGVRDGGG
jgi:hypothetical protein